MQSALQEIRDSAGLPLPFAELALQEEPLLVLNVSMQRLEELRDTWEAIGNEYIEALGTHRYQRQTMREGDHLEIHASQLDAYWHRWFCNTFVNYY